MISIVLAVVAAAPLPLEPATIAFGAPEAALVVTAGEGVTALKVQPANGVGAVSAAEPAGAGKFRFRYTLPAERYDGPRLAVSVRGELYGSCIRRVSRSELADNGLPIGVQLMAAYWEEDRLLAFGNELLASTSE